MRVVLNSDVLYGDFSNGLPDGLVHLGEACKEQGHVLVVPLTTLLEVERRQREIVASQRKAVAGARQTLVDQGVTVPDFQLGDVVPKVDVRDMLADLAADVEVESPEIEDFEDAHRRACLHESPHPPDIKSDEMRDLVIWAISLRLSAQDGHALLVSRDVLHTHGRGDSEAASVHLARVDSLDAALEYLDVKTPAGEQLEAMISPSWGRIRDAGLPLGDTPMLLSVKNVQFIQGRTGPSLATGWIKIRGLGGDLISAQVEVEVTAESTAQLSLSNVLVDGKPVADIAVTADYEPTEIEDDSERFVALRALLEEN